MLSSLYHDDKLGVPVRHHYGTVLNCARQLPGIEIDADIARGFSARARHVGKTPWSIVRQPRTGAPNERESSVDRVLYSRK